MKKIILALAFVTAIGNIATAQKEVKYEKLFYKDLTKETGDLKIMVDNAISTPAETKFKLKITNLTGDFIILKPEECVFMINGKELKPKEKWLIIKPNESDYRVINLKGTGYNEVKSYSFSLDGLYSVSSKGTVVSAPDFDLPAAKNDFEAGDFKCTVSNISKETDKTEAKFKCVYNGNKVGVVQTTKASAKFPDGKEYANAKSKSGAFLLMKGQDDTFTLKWERMEGGKAMDMQKVPMVIIWHETFMESEIVKLKSEKLDLEFDEVKSAAKK